MEFKWDQELKEGQKSNPVCHYKKVDLPSGFFEPSDEELSTIFPTKNYTLQTWARAKTPDGKIITVNDPHWLAVRGGTPLHTDPRYPRYSHQLKIRVGDGVVMRGKDKVETPLATGVFYILDTHSPHQVYCTQDKKAWNITVSLDHKIMLNPLKTLPRLLQWCEENRDSFVSSYVPKK